MKKQASQFRLLPLELWSIVYDGISSVWKWLYQSWLVGWDVIFDIITFILMILLSRQVWIFLLVIIIFLSTTFGPSTLSQAIPQINEWQVISVSNKDLEIFFHHPRYVAGDDYTYFEVSIQNASDKPLYDVIVSIRSPEGLIIFDGDNLVTKKLLLPGATIAKKLPFHTAQSIGNNCIKTVVVSAFKFETGQEQRQTWQQNTPNLCVSVWRTPAVISRKLPEAFQTIATYVGYISSMLAGLILLFREQLRPLGEPIWKFLKR